MLASPLVPSRAYTLYPERWYLLFAFSLTTFSQVSARIILVAPRPLPLLPSLPLARHECPTNPNFFP